MGLPTESHASVRSLWPGASASAMAAPSASNFVPVAGVVDITTSPSSAAEPSRKRSAEGDAGSLPAQRARSQCASASTELLLQTPEVQQLTAAQLVTIRHFISILDSEKDSVVITNPLVANAPIVHVTQAWQAMCGYTSQEAVGSNPRLTQGKDSDAHAIETMKHAICERRACKVRIINYRGHTREPFWNCLTMHPIFAQKKLVLFVGRLQDYSYRLSKLMSLQPAQFCKIHEQLQCRIRLSNLRRASTLSAPLSIELDTAVGEVEEGRVVELSQDCEQEMLPQIPTQHVKRLTIPHIALEPEYLSDRLRDECQQLGLPCQAAEMLAGGAELSRLEVFKASPVSGGEGVRALLHVMPEDLDGSHGISFTRLSGDTFQFHALFRSLKSRLKDLHPTDVGVAST